MPRITKGQIIASYRLRSFDMERIIGESEHEASVEKLEGMACGSELAVLLKDHICILTSDHSAQLLRKDQTINELTMRVLELEVENRLLKENRIGRRGRGL